MNKTFRIEFITKSSIFDPVSKDNMYIKSIEIYYKLSLHAIIFILILK